MNLEILKVFKWIEVYMDKQDDKSIVLSEYSEILINF